MIEEWSCVFNFFQKIHKAFKFTKIEEWSCYIKLSYLQRKKSGHVYSVSSGKYTIMVSNKLSIVIRRITQA